ncbi:Uncharacterised protein [Neisseria meningitidis]|nr:Uncharacterised protein [Neisseria meningitidis]CKL36317.1 Uncharacterised protein [Neisseria meningitidis]CKL47286.1 Uncharacterised protein [Neisseria meningitidis]
MGKLTVNKTAQVLGRGCFNINYLGMTTLYRSCIKSRRTEGQHQFFRINLHGFKCVPCINGAHKNRVIHNLGQIRNLRYI